MYFYYQFNYFAEKIRFEAQANSHRPNKGDSLSTELLQTQLCTRNLWIRRLSHNPKLNKEECTFNSL